MTIAEKLGKSLEEAMEMSTLEFQMWIAFYELKKEIQEELSKR